MNREIEVGTRVELFVAGRWTTTQYVVREVVRRLTTKGNQLAGYRVSGYGGVVIDKRWVRVASGGAAESQLGFFDTVTEIPTEAPTHADDPWTSKHAAQLSSVKRGKERHRLLAEYAKFNEGLTDDEAGFHATIEGEYDARRHCTVLRKHGLIERTGETRPSHRGNPAMVCRITELGHRLLLQVERSAV